MSIRYVYIPKSYRGGAMAVPKRFADFNPVSVSYSPLVPIISEASATPIPVTKKAAKEIQSSGIPLGKIVSYIGNFAKKAASNPDFNALMGVVAQYLLNYVNEDIAIIIHL